MGTTKDFETMSDAELEKIALAVEADEGQALPGLRESLADLRAGRIGAIHTPEQIAARKRGRPAGSTKEDNKISTTIRLDADVLEALKATGKGWQTRLNDLIRADIQAGRLKALA